MIDNSDKTVPQEDARVVELPIKGGHSPKSLNDFTPRRLAELALDYFNRQIRIKKPFTINGLAKIWHCTWTDIRDYSSKDEYLELIKKCRNIILEEAEQRLHTSGAAGAMFLLKQFGWRDDVGRPGIQINISQGELTPARRSDIGSIIEAIYAPRPGLCQPTATTVTGSFKVSKAITIDNDE